MSRATPSQLAPLRGDGDQYTESSGRIKPGQAKEDDFDVLSKLSKSSQASSRAQNENFGTH